MGLKCLCICDACDVVYGCWFWVCGLMVFVGFVDAIVLLDL